MTFHFVKRDFATNWFVWALVGAFFLFLQLAPDLFQFAPDKDDVIDFSFPLLLLFAMIGSGKIEGVKFRSQNLMSRNYLLALPIERNRMFRIVVARIFIHYIPVLLYSLSMPFWSRSFERFSEPLSWFWFAVFAVSATFAFIVSSTLLNLWTEEVSGFADRRARFFGRFGVAGGFGIMNSLVWAPLAAFVLTKNSYAVLLVLIPLATFAFSYRAARTLWFGH